MRVLGLLVALVVPVSLVPGPAPPVVPVGAYAWPVAVDASAPVTRLFEPPPHAYGPGHRGVDLAGRPGQPVLAAGAGTVVFAGRLAGRGVVSVAHPDGLRTTYEPLAVTVAAGAPVARGSPLGTLEPGHARCPIAACLHWGLRRSVPAGTEYLDPLLLLGLGRVRLLPF